MTMRSHDHLVQDQFGSMARDYVASVVHAAGADLTRIADVAATRRPAHALDLGTGGGHVAYAIAPHATRVTAFDLSAEMLAAVAAESATRGLTHIETVPGRAEALPFADATFDFLACRFSAHHWGDLALGLSEARRVLAPGAPALYADIIAPPLAAADTHLQAVELLRDPSHVRDYREDEWRAALARAGFTVATVTTARLRMDFPTWTARMRTPPAHAIAIRALQALASAEVAAHFEIEPDGSFTIDTALIEAA